MTPQNWYYLGCSLAAGVLICFVLAIRALDDEKAES